MSAIPEFAQAVQEFESYLRREGFAKRIVWVFRDDLWQWGRTRVLLRWPEPSHTRELIEKVFAEGKAKGLVEIVAVAQAGDSIVVTVRYPKYKDGEVRKSSPHPVSPN
jgi:hypothetical protein